MGRYGRQGKRGRIAAGPLTRSGVMHMNRQGKAGFVGFDDGEYITHQAIKGLVTPSAVGW